MAETFFVDTGYLIALAIEDDAHCDAARRWAQYVAARRVQLVTHAGILLEFGDALSDPDDWPRASFAIRAIVEDRRTDVAAVDRVMTGRARTLRDRRADQDWGLTDCASFEIMRARRITAALSADRHFVQAGFRALLLE